MTPFITLQDSVLIERTLAGQSECFGVLMDRHMKAVRKRVQMLLRNTSDEDDLVQETFLKAWRHLSTLRSDANFRAWVTRVATNEVLQQHRRDRRRPANVSAVALDHCVAPGESPHDTVSRSETRQAVRSAVAGLPSKYREILHLCEFEGLTMNEAAGRLRSGIPVVKSRLFRARRMLSMAIQGQKAA